MVLEITFANDFDRLPLGLTAHTEPMSGCGRCLRFDPDEVRRHIRPNLGGSRYRRRTTIAHHGQDTRRRLEVPLNSNALTVLLEKQAAKHGPYVFYNHETGDRFRDTKTGFKAALKRAGLTGITWHTLRHTFASRLTRSRVDLLTVKELLGHSTINTTMRYAHSNHETKARAVAQLPKRDKIVTFVPRKQKKGLNVM